MAETVFISKDNYIKAITLLNTTIQITDSVYTRKRIEEVIDLLTEVKIKEEKK